MIDFNGMSTSLALFYAYRLKKIVHKRTKLYDIKYSYPMQIICN